MNPLQLTNMPEQYYYYIAAGVCVFLAAIIAGYYYFRYRAAREDGLEELMIDDEDEVRFKPPEMKGGPLDYFRVMRHLQRQHKLAKKGYVKWFRLGSTMGRPTWVKPDRDGTGTPKHTVDGEPYYFPKESMVADEVSGAWVAVHREGEGDPINLRDPAYPGIETDIVERIINMEAESNPPGWLSQFGGMSTQALLWGGMALLFLVYAGVRYYA